MREEKKVPGMWKEGIVQQSRGASSSELLSGGKIRVSAQKLREQKEIVFIPAFS